MSFLLPKKQYQRTEGMIHFRKLQEVSRNIPKYYTFGKFTMLPVVAGTDSALWRRRCCHSALLQPWLRPLAAAVAHHSLLQLTWSWPRARTPGPTYQQDTQSEHSETPIHTDHALTECIPLLVLSIKHAGHRHANCIEKEREW